MPTAQSGCSVDECRWSNVRNGHRQAHRGAALISTRCVCIVVPDSAAANLMLQGGKNNSNESISTKDNTEIQCKVRDRRLATQTK